MTVSYIHQQCSSSEKIYKFHIHTEICIYCKIFKKNMFGHVKFLKKYYKRITIIS